MARSRGPSRWRSAVAEPIDDGYPIVVRLAGRKVLVVGGGAIALRKATGLLAAGAAVTVISPEFVDGLDTGSATLVRRPYATDDVAGHWLVIAATDDPAVQQQVFDDGQRHGVFVNAVDDPDRCSFILPAVERRGPVLVAVSTQGRSPALAARLRDRLAAALPDDVADVAEHLAAERRQIRAEGGSTEAVDWSASLDEL